MNIAIIGSRNFNDYTTIENTLLEFISTEKPSDIKIVSGGAIGADSLGKQFAVKHNLLHTEFLPDWKKFGRGAGIRRNTIIIENSEVIFAFWDMKSKGTSDSITKVRKMDKRVIIVEVKEVHNGHK